MTSILQTGFIPSARAYTPQMSTLYGSPFWVLQPIFLLLLTGFAFAMLGLSLERILNPRVIADIPVAVGRRKPENQTRGELARLRKKVVVGLLVALLATALFIPVVQGKTLASLFMSYFDEARTTDTLIKHPEATLASTVQLVSTPLTTHVPATPTELSSTPMPSVMPSPAR